MTAASSRNPKLSTADLTLLKYQVDELKKGQDRIETKLDLINYVPLTNYNDDKKALEKTYATIESLQGMEDFIKSARKVFWAVATTILIGMVTAVLTFVVNGGLAK